MSGEAWLYLLAVLINAVNLFLQVFFTIMYSDLEWYVIYILRLHSYPFIAPRYKMGRDTHGFLCRSGEAGMGVAFSGEMIADGDIAVITSIPSICATALTHTLFLRREFTLS